MTIDLNQLMVDGKCICTESQMRELKQMLSSHPDNSPSQEQIWQMMDDVWERLGCDNQNLNWEKIAAFYSHPVWILNGLFIEQDQLSIQHRQSISNWINSHSDKIKYILDYGGGMGTLAKLIAESNPDFYIDIYEPYPSQVAIAKLRNYQTIQFVDKLKANTYDCLVSTDVLEHVADPLTLFAQMIGSVKLNGYLVIANCFAPTIECHLPTTFHLCYTFKIFAKLMGLKRLGVCGGSHAMIYCKEREKSINWKQIRQIEALSRLSYPLLDVLYRVYKGWFKT